MSDKKEAENSNEEYLGVLRTALVDNNPPFCSGTLPIDAKDLLLYYGEGDRLGRVDFSNVAERDLERLVRACEPAKFGRNKEDVYDESIRKAGKLDADKFATKIDLTGNASGVSILDAIRFGLLDGKQMEDTKSSEPDDDWESMSDSLHESTKSIRAELYKLNIYGKDGFFKSHQDTPRSTDMFGSLVIVLPTVHAGGALVFRHKDKEWVFDSARALAEAPQKASIAYVAFFSDVAHEVSVVEAGYRVTLTYNLYFAPPLDLYTPRIPTASTIPTNLTLFRTALAQSLADPSFLPSGGLLGFGLHHQYPVDANRQALPHISSVLKGSDALVLTACQALGLHAAVYLLYDDALLLPEEPRHGTEIENSFLRGALEYYDGRVVNDRREFDEPYGGGKFAYEKENIIWVTKQTVYNRVKTEYTLVREDLYFGNEAGAQFTYATPVLIADIGPAGAREKGKRPSEPEAFSDSDSDF
ncbi:hypothetical protein DFH11DRAFT_1622364 [Phellopilus nigrolimitatus]|nr:hypothetical protein DFH11DRAFT_1622364 [Phellopilus nigrolimitatus]